MAIFLRIFPIPFSLLPKCLFPIYFLIFMLLSFCFLLLQPIFFQRDLCGFRSESRTRKVKISPRANGMKWKTLLGYIKSNPTYILFFSGAHKDIEYSPDVIVNWSEFFVPPLREKLKKELRKLIHTYYATMRWKISLC